MFSKYTKFDNAPRSGPKVWSIILYRNKNFLIDEFSQVLLISTIYIQAFVSEYAVWKEDAGAGSLYAAVAEAAFLIGLEKNRFGYI